MSNDIKKNYCLNCYKATNSTSKFCAHCGQKVDFDISSIKGIFMDFISNLFYIDGKMWKTIKALFIPGKLTKKYVAGNRKSYLNPFRIFFICAVFFFATFNSYMTKTFSTVNIYGSSLEEKYQNIKNYDKREMLLDSLNIKDSIKNEELRDRINFVYGLNKKNQRNHNRNQKKDTTLITDFNINDITTKYKISNTDIYNLSKDSLIAKYHIVKTWDKIIISQTLRLNKDPNGAFLYFFNNFIWGIFFVVALCVLFLKLFYIRHKPLLVELTLILFEFHSVLFIAGGIFFIIFRNNIQFNSVPKQILPILLFSFIYYLILIKNYFKQSWIKSLFKTIVFAGFYFFSMILFFALTFIVSLIIF